MNRAVQYRVKGVDAAKVPIRVYVEGTAFNEGRAVKTWGFWLAVGDYTVFTFATDQSFNDEVPARGAHVDEFQALVERIKDRL